MGKNRLKDRYKKEIVPKLYEQLGLKNIMQVPRLTKVVLNMGVKEAVTNSKKLQDVEKVMQKVSGQKPVRTVARKSIAGFKLRQGMPIGAKVTLRDDMMFAFLDKLINFGLPRVRDFQGVPRRFDGRGNYNLGLKEWVFPEVDYEEGHKLSGLNITIGTTTDNDDYARALLEQFGMPFAKDTKAR